jgi:hypothetical protein
MKLFLLPLLLLLTPSIYAQSGVSAWTYVSFPVKEVNETHEVDALTKNLSYSKEHPERFALIIGNEHYDNYRLGLPDVAYAQRDARAFRCYAKALWGVPERNTFYIEDGTAGLIRSQLDRLCLLLRTEKNATVFFYFAGHGLPDNASASFIPTAVDSDPKNTPLDLSFMAVLNKLNQQGKNRVIAFTDACFSGRSRSGGSLMAARGVKYVPVLDAWPQNTVHFAGSRSGEYSFAWDEKQHGLFTQVLLSHLNNAGANDAWGAVVELVRLQVMERAARLHFASQEPFLDGDPFLVRQFKQQKIK